MLTRAEECRLKHAAVVEYLNAHGLDAVVLSRRPHFAWFTAGGLNHVSTAADVGAASLLVTRERALCLTNNIEAPRIAAEDLDGLEIELVAWDWWDETAAARHWSHWLKGLAVAVDAPVPAAGRDLPLLDGDFEQLRMQLNEAEIARYRQLGPEVGEALESACRQAHPGMSEHELAAGIAAALRERAIRAPVILVANEERVRKFRHPLPTAAKFNRYGMGVCCAEREGLYISVTRLFSFVPIGDDLRRRHEAVSAVDAAMIAATRPGATLGDVFAVCRRAYADGGFAEDWRLHHQGGQIGYIARENRAVPESTVPVLANQAYGWNPSITGTKSEDTILVLPERTEIFTATGQWPTRTYTAAGQTYERNEILRI